MHDNKIHIYDQECTYTKICLSMKNCVVNNIIFLDFVCFCLHSNSNMYEIFSLQNTLSSIFFWLFLFIRIKNLQFSTLEYSFFIHIWVSYILSHVVFLFRALGYKKKLLVNQFNVHILKCNNFPYHYRDKQSVWTISI